MSHKNIYISSDHILHRAKEALLQLEQQGRFANEEQKNISMLANSGFFDSDYYLAAYPDVATSGLDPLVHYVRHGLSEKRNPAAWFDTEFYLQTYADVQNAQVNPFLHYICKGHDEHRSPHPTVANTQSSYTYLTYEDFVTQPVRKNCVLVVEPNRTSHAEVLPGYCKYLSDLGFNIDVLLRNIQANKFPFSRTTMPRLQKYAVDFSQLKQIFYENKIYDYAHILFTSYTMYERIDKNIYPCIFDHFPVLEKLKNKIFAVVHHTDKYDDYLSNKNQHLLLSNKITPPHFTAHAINPHYFGNISITPKNTAATHFIVVGSIETERRNTNILISSLMRLLDMGITNFKVTIIGRGSIVNFPPVLHNYVEILNKKCKNIYESRSDFPTVYTKMEEADYFLPLLDPESTVHNEYVTTATSGSFQLIYGFRKPCLIAKKFALHYDFSPKNCIIYEKNSDLLTAIMNAIHMSNVEYLKMQESLDCMAKRIYYESLANFSKLLKL